MEASFLMQIGERLRAFRDYRLVSREGLARLCGVQGVIIYGLETGTYKAPYSLYEDICITLGFTARDLFGGFHWTYTPPASGKENACVKESRIA